MIIAIGLIGLISCKKDNELQQSKTEIKIQAENLSQQRIANGFDFDQFGISHNNYLNFISSHSDSSDTPEERYNTGKYYIDSYFGSFNSEMSWQDFEPTVTFTQNISNQILEGTFDAHSLADEGYVSEAMAPFLNELAALFTETADKELTPEEFTALIEQLESNIAQSQTITFDESNFQTNDGGAMLAMCAISKYSYQYWYDHVTNENPEGTALQRNIFGKAWRAIKIASVDAYGFIAEGWRDSDGNGIKDTWSSDVAIENASQRSDAVR